MLYAVLPPSQYKVLLKPYMSPLCRFLSFCVLYVSLHCNVASLYAVLRLLSATGCQDPERTGDCSEGISRAKASAQTRHKGTFIY